MFLKFLVFLKLIHYSIHKNLFSIKHLNRFELSICFIIIIPHLKNFLVLLKEFN